MYVHMCVHVKEHVNNSYQMHKCCYSIYVHKYKYICKYITVYVWSLRFPKKLRIYLLQSAQVF